MSKNLSLRYAALVFLAAVIFPAAAQAQSAFDDPGARTAAGTSGDLKPVQEKVEAGGVLVGSSSQVVVLFRNDDGKPLKTGAINLYPSSNITASVGENQCAAEAIQPGEICAVSIQVKGLQAGKYRIEMLMRHEGRAKLLTATINGSVEKAGDGGTDLANDVEVIPNEIDFGSLNESRSQVKAVILRNKTSKPITINDIKMDAGFESGFTVQSNCKELPVGAACIVTVMWAPQQKGPSTGTLIVNHSGATGVAAIEVTGEYDPEVADVAEIFPEAVPGKGLLTSSLKEVNFGTGVSQSSSITASLVNIGDVPLTLTDIRMANSENGVRAENSGCRPGVVLAPLEACPLTLTWEPVREGTIVDDMQVLHTGARGVLVMPLRGTASRAINKDAKAINLSGDYGANAIIEKIQPLSMDEILDDGDAVIEDGDKAVIKKPSKAEKKSGDADKDTAPARVVDVRGVLDGYTITSYSAKRAIISGPGGSRVVFEGEHAVIGGVLWEITMRPSAIEFRNGDQKVLLLFDRSLSSVNLIGTQSGSGGTTTSSGTSTSSSTTTP
ncbi:MAG TPA: choice-of-anchor D domain-containing protein [Micavibrio sp.]|nr:choice-of-anchor D domain-containing protein [Micavibrio sp.]